MEYKLDKTLALFYQQKKILYADLQNNRDIPEILKCVKILLKDGYISRYWQPAKYDRYDITPSGEKFHEDGGYGAPRRYNEEILGISKKSLHIAIAAFVISIVALLFSILFGILQIPINKP